MKTAAILFVFALTGCMTTRKVDPAAREFYGTLIAKAVIIAASSK